MGQKYQKILEPARKCPLVASRKLDTLTHGPKTAALYIHFPFCNIRCGYCDFYTVTKRKPEIPAFLVALKREMSLYSLEPDIQSNLFETIYFGGGTPSLLQPKQIFDIIRTVRDNFTIVEHPEVTLETNPGTVDRDKLSEIRQSGVNRLSIGVQSFHLHELKFLDRDHSAGDAVACFENGRQAGFDNISIDLIWGLPKQKLSAWEENLNQAVHLRPDHISAYNLTYEDGTPLTKKRARQQNRTTDEESQRAMQIRTIEILQTNGYEHYEISNFARPGFHSQHNTKYWDGSPYLSLGPSAHSMLGNRRFWNPRSLRQYTDLISAGQFATTGEERLSPEDRAFELIFLGLRQRRGLDLRNFETVTGVSFCEQYQAALEKLFSRKIHNLEWGTGNRIESEFLIFENGFLRLTDAGVLLCDAVCREFS